MKSKASLFLLAIFMATFFVRPAWTRGENTQAPLTDAISTAKSFPVIWEDPDKWDNIHVFETFSNHVDRLQSELDHANDLLQQLIQTQDPKLDPKILAALQVARAQIHSLVALANTHILEELSIDSLLAKLSELDSSLDEAIQATMDEMTGKQ